MNLLELDKSLTRGVLVKPEFVAVAGDLAAGTLLSQIVYWNRPDKSGAPKIKLHYDGKAWIAKTCEEWCDECSLTQKQFRRVVRHLESIGLIERLVKQFRGLPTSHISLNHDALLAALNAHLGYEPKGQPEVG